MLAAMKSTTSMAPRDEEETKGRVEDEPLVPADQMMLRLFGPISG
jgi:hypothetical protein